MSIRHCLLALLDSGPGHGYQLHAQLAHALGEPWSINTGQVYATLSRLEQEGFVLRSDEPIEGYGDRAVYQLTKDGRDELVRWFLEPISRGDRLRDFFYAKLILSCLSSAVSSSEVLQTQRKQLMSELQDLTQLRRRAAAERKLAPLLMIENGIMHLEADLRWLDMCWRRLDELAHLPPPGYLPRPRGRPSKGSEARSM